MSQDKALTIRPTLDMATWTVIQAISPTMHASRLFGVTSPEAAAAIALKGFELGLGITASYEHISMVMGKLTLSPRGALAIVMRSGELAGFKLELDDRHCVCWMKRRNGIEHSETFTMDDARRAGLVKSGGAWESYPRNMLKWRAVGFAIDTLFGDITGGMRRADEFGADVDTDGNVIQGEWTTAPDPAPTPAPAPTTPIVTLDDLVTQYGADAVVAAANGQIPGSDEEVALVATILGATANA